MERRSFRIARRSHQTHNPVLPAPLCVCLCSRKGGKRTPKGFFRGTLLITLLFAASLRCVRQTKVFSAPFAPVSQASLPTKPQETGSVGCVCRIVFRVECEANYDWRVMIKFRVCVIMLSNMFIPKAESSVAAYPSNARAHPRLSAMSAVMLREPVCPLRWECTCARCCCRGVPPSGPDPALSSAPAELLCCLLINNCIRLEICWMDGNFSTKGDCR